MHESLVDNFTHFNVVKAVLQTQDGEEVVLLESRITMREEELLFTVVQGKAIRVSSIHDLVYAIPLLVSLKIRHSVQLMWGGSMRKAELVEIFTPDPEGRVGSIALLQLCLTVDEKTYETTQCETLQDAIWELQELSESEVQWRLSTCYHCRYSGHARNYSLSDRRYWCYRDVPEAFIEIQAKGKYASLEARFAGAYFVTAFHTCAGWMPL